MDTKIDHTMRLVDKWGNRIREGSVGQRELARIENISRRRVRKIMTIARENAPSDPGRKRLFEFVSASNAAREVIEESNEPDYGPENSGAGSDVEHILGVGANEPVDMEELVARAIQKFDKADALQQRKDTQEIKFKGGPVCLVFAGDEHFGGATNIRRMLDEARLVNDTPGMYHVRMGDSVNQFILGRMRSIRDNVTIGIKEEWILAKMLIDLISEKLVALVGGNHDHWAEVASGVDRLADIIPNGVLYDKHQLVFTVNIAGVKRVVKLRHRWKGSSVFNPTHGIEVAAQRDVADFDVGVAAHTHTAALTRDFFAQGKRRIAVLTNTYKEHDEFPIEIGFPKSDSSSTAACVIFEESGFMQGSCNLKWAARYMREAHARR